MVTYAGFDAFWAERVKKEVKTQMRHQVHHGIVNSGSIDNMYRQMREGIDTQAQSRKINRQIKSMKQLKKRKKQKNKTES